MNNVHERRSTAGDKNGRYNMWTYKKRIEKDLGRWREQGWVTEAGATAIRAELASGGRGVSLSTALGILAAVLIGFSVMSFVGANWQDIPRIVRLCLLLVALALSYAGAGALFARGMEGFGHAMVLLATSLFGANIMLISQMYHMSGNPADAVLVWAAGTLLAGVAIRSNPALALAMILVSLWGWLKTVDWNAVYWPYLLGWAPVAAAFYWLRWKPGIHVAGLPLAAFIISLGFLLNDGHAHGLVALIGFAAVAAALSGSNLKPDTPALWSGMLGYAVTIAFAGLYALQFYESPDLGALIVLAVLTLAGLILAIWWGLHSGHRGLLWLGYIGFSLEILSIYAKKFGTLLDTSLFFLIAGLLVASLAYMAYRLHGRNESHQEART
jgi:uncharacterized membrane protein